MTLTCAVTCAALPDLVSEKSRLTGARGSLPATVHTSGKTAPQAVAVEHAAAGVKQLCDYLNPNPAGAGSLPAPGFSDHLKMSFSEEQVDAP